MRIQAVIKITVLIVFIGFFSCENELDTEIEIETSDFSVFIDENLSEDQVLGTVQGSTNMGNVTFEIVSQSPEGALVIDQTTGVLKVKNASLYDFETHSIITGTVKVANGATFKNAKIYINIGDVDEIEIETSDFSVIIDENSSANQVLGAVQGSTNIGNVTFEIVSQSPEGAFEIDRVTGVLTIKDSSLYDFETSPVITGTFKVVNGEHFKNAKIYIKLGDIVEIETSDFSVTIDENPSTNQVLGAVEGSINSGNITFEIVSQSPEGAFEIDPVTGILTVKDATLYDFDTSPIISGTVKVSNGSLFVNSTVTILLNDLVECVESRKMSENFFQNLVEKEGYVRETTMDAETHSYTFQMDVSGAICSIGYQGITDAPYLIEVVDKNNNIIYSGDHSFSMSHLEYIDIAPIKITANESYTIKRTVKSFIWYSEVIGNIVRLPHTQTGSFPISSGSLTIIGTPAFSSLPAGYIIIPYINFGFTQN